MLETGRVIERYTVEGLLGEGGMAAVYRVKHTHLGTDHALKVLTLTNRSIRERLLTEGRVQATLQHPNAVTVQDVLDIDGAPGLLMEFVDGPDLARWIEETDYDLELAESVFRGIVAAVAEAHDRGLVHRDLKPANVLMASTATGWVPKVADFGLAKLVLDNHSSDGSGHATRTGVAMGTPAYMAPEQIRDAKNVDQRADIFSLGCILYQLVTRQAPFHGADIVELFTAVTSGDFLPPREHLPDLPEHFVRAIEAALQTDRDRRCPDCTSLLALLDGEAPSNLTFDLPDSETTVPRAPPSPATLPAPSRPIPTADPPPDRTLPAPELPAPTLLAVAAIPLAGLGGMAVMALIALAWTWTSGPASTDPDGEPAAREEAAESTSEPRADTARVSALCGVEADTVAGYAQASPVFFKKKGGMWVLPKERPVHVEAPSEANDWTPSDQTACTLPSGTAVRLTEDPIKVRGSGHWVAVVPSAVMLPKDYDGP